MKPKQKIGIIESLYIDKKTTDIDTTKTLKKINKIKNNKTDFDNNIINKIVNKIKKK